MIKTIFVEEFFVQLELKLAHSNYAMSRLIHSGLSSLNRVFRGIGDIVAVFQSKEQDVHLRRKLHILRKLISKETELSAMNLLVGSELHTASSK